MFSTQHSPLCGCSATAQRTEAHWLKHARQLPAQQVRHPHKAPCCPFLKGARLISVQDAGEWTLSYLEESAEDQRSPQRDAEARQWSHGAARLRETIQAPFLGAFMTRLQCRLKETNPWLYFWLRQRSAKLSPHQENYKWKGANASSLLTGRSGQWRSERVTRGSSVKFATPLIITSN